MDETLKWTIQNFTAYANAQKEHSYNIRHAYGREGHGKGLGMPVNRTARICISIQGHTVVYLKYNQFLARASIMAVRSNIQKN